MNELVSIIIPVYNVAQYLPECVDSVLNQTYSNLEILLVDDGSTDASGQLCDAYAQQDERVRVVHKENGGLSSARNAGLDICTGNYVYFLDSDDFMEESVIERYLTIIRATGADVCRGSFTRFWGEVPNSQALCRPNAPAETFSAIEALKLMLLDRKLYHAATCGLFKTGLLEGIRFPVGLLYEDFATTYYVIARCSKVAFTDDGSYFYRTRPDSIMNAKVKQRDMVLLDIAQTIKQDMTALYPEVEPEAVRKLVVAYLKFYSRILYTGFHTFEEEQQRIRAAIAEYREAFLASGYASKSDRIKLIAFRLGKLPFYLMYKLSDRMQLLQQSR